MKLDWLPPLLAEIAEVTSLDAALRLAEKRGGSRISIPAKMPDDHWIAVTIGITHARALAEHFRGGNSGALIELPVGADALKRKRIDELLAQGVSADKIAVELQVHRTTVFRHQRRNGKIPDPRQGSLFCD